MNNQTESTSSKGNTSSLAVDINQIQNTKMTEDFQTWILRKLNDMQEKTDTQHKETIQKIQGLEETFIKEIGILKRKSNRTSGNEELIQGITFFLLPPPFTC